MSFETNPPMSSLLQCLSAFSNILQRTLFPALEQDLGQLTQQHRTLVETLALLQVDGFVKTERGRGRPAHSRANIMRSFVAKAVLSLPHTRALLDRLQSDAALRRICGWESVTSVPDETVFSRAFAEFAATEAPQRVHAALIKRSYAEQVAGHISRDSTAIIAREKDQSKQKVKRPRASRRKNRTPEQMTRIERQCLPETTMAQITADLPRLCDKGCKNDSKGLPSYWIGYKLHLDVTDGQVPVSCLLTSASLHDSQAAIPLLQGRGSIDLPAGGSGGSRALGSSANVAVAPATLATASAMCVHNASMSMGRPASSSSVPGVLL